MVDRIDLQPRDEAILEHIARYRMTTPDVLHRTFFGGKGKDAVTSTIRRLRRGQLIAAADLAPPRRCYYHLTCKATRVLGVPSSLARSLGEQALPTRFAALCFCSEGERELLRPTDFAREFPNCLSTHLPNEPYYYDSEGAVPRLGFIMVDLGADAGRIIRKCRKVIAERKTVDGFREVIEQDAFVITILTGRVTKRDAIEAARKRAQDFPYPIRTEAVRELTGVI